MRIAQYLGYDYLSLHWGSKYKVIGEITDKITGKVDEYVLDVSNGIGSAVGIRARAEDVVISNEPDDKVLNNNSNKMANKSKLQQLISEDYFTKEKIKEIKEVVKQINSELSTLKVTVSESRKKIEYLENIYNCFDEGLENDNEEMIEETLIEYNKYIYGAKITNI